MKADRLALALYLSLEPERREQVYEAFGDVAVAADATKEETDDRNARRRLETERVYAETVLETLRSLGERFPKWPNEDPVPTL